MVPRSPAQAGIRIRVLRARELPPVGQEEVERTPPAPSVAITAIAYGDSTPVR